MNDQVLLIIVSYKHPEILDQCLYYLLNQTYKNIDICVWDNGAHCASLKDKYSDIVNFHFSDENILWTPAINKCIQKNLQNHHKYILIMNHDILLPKVAVERLVNNFQIADNNPGIVAPAGSSIGGLQDFISHKTLPNTSDWSTDLQNKIANYGLERSAYAMGAIQMIKRELYDTIGGLDNEMPLGADDFDYSIRAKEANFSIWIAYNIYVNHIGHVTGQSSNWNDFGELSWKRFNEKYDGYFSSEEEAIQSLWGAKYNPLFPVGTGISLDEKIKRGIINGS